MADVRDKNWIPSDEDWNRLIDDKVVSSRRKEAEKKYGNLTQDQINFIRKRAKTDLFFLATGLLEYELLTENLHGHYCNWLQKYWGVRHRSTLMPRGHFKSTINTISDSIQMALTNDAGVTAYPYSLGPDIKLLIAHENRESAARFLFEITEAFTAKQAMLAFFPELIPSRGAQRLNKWELELPRRVHPKEPTFDTLGVGGAEQGKHYNWLKFDDIFGTEARDSKVVTEGTNRWFANASISLKTRRKIDGWDLTGTHYNNSDTYSYAYKLFGVDKTKSFIKNYFKKDIARLREGEVILYGRAIVEENKIILPEEITWEDIEVLKRNPIDYAAQHANNPRDSGISLFQTNWLKYYNFGVGDRIYVFAGDNSWSVDRKDLDVCILVDPSMGQTQFADPTGIVVTGTDKNMNIYILEAYQKRLKAPDLIDELFKLYTRWWPRVISVESVNFSAYVGHWFNDKCNQMRLYPNIHYYKVGRSPKISNTRIGGLTNYFAAGQVYMLEGQTQLRDQIEWFPLGDDEHILDALAQGPEVWQKGLDRNTQKEMELAVNALTEERDALTGY